MLAICYIIDFIISDPLLYALDKELNFEGVLYYLIQKLTKLFTLKDWLIKKIPSCQKSLDVLKIQFHKISLQWLFNKSILKFWMFSNITS